MARYRGYDGLNRFPPSVPREVEGGIRAHSRRGAFASSWWGRRWIEVLEGFGLGARLRRGRRYARKGQVLTLDVEPGSVDATVQGSRARPYRVEIRLPSLSGEEWAEVVARLAAEVRIGARLLAGAMPPEVEQVVDEAGVRLFPDRLKDLETSCSCPDWSNPCKHIAAVHYLLAEELDRDPFLLFRLRGMDRDRFTAALVEAGEAAGLVTGASPSGPGRAGDGERGATEEGEDDGAWPTDPVVFWGRPAGGVAEEDPEAGTAPAPEARPPDVPTSHAPLIRRLGAFPFWRGERPFLDEMVEIYRRASSEARVLLGGGTEP